jgi:hypothetical protein
VTPAPSAADPWKRLDTWRSNTTSQCGEDGLIAHLLTLFPDTPKTCLEVGAGNGISLSNTNTLWSKLGWKALLNEADDNRFAGLQANTSGIAGAVIEKAMITPRGESSLDAIARRHAFPREIGIMSLDIDSNDLEIFENIEWLLADIVIIEFNHEIPPDIAYRDMPGDLYFRHSAKAVEIVARARGYRVVACSGPNAFLVREALIDAKAAAVLPDLPVEAMYDHGFMRTRRDYRYRNLLATSKTLTHDIAVTGNPGVLVRAVVRVMVWGRRLRALLRGRPAIGTSTPARRAHLRKSGFWV